jgi:hypothetical protein
MGKFHFCAAYYQSPCETDEAVGAHPGQVSEFSMACSLQRILIGAVGLPNLLTISVTNACVERDSHPRCASHCWQ